MIGLLLFKKNFISLMEKRFQNLELANAGNLAQLKFQKTLRTAIENYKYGDDYHLQALATVLSKNIFIFSYFTKNGNLILPNSLTSQELSNHFLNKSKNIGHHLRYEPIANNILSPACSNDNLNGFYSAKTQHYTALIPKS